MNNNDLSHFIGADLSISATGDVQSCTDTTRGQQRVLRRLLTNPGDYVFHPNYGAGLSKYVGQLADLQKVKALIRGQMLLEESVAKLPEPDIQVKTIAGGIAVSIKYVDALTKQPASLNFNVSK